VQLSRVLILAIVAMSGLGVIVPSSEAVGQTLNEQLVGAWTYVSVDTVRPDGSRTPMYGPNPQGLVIFDGHGHYALVNARAGQPKFTSNDRMKGTPVENEAVVHGSIAHFGRYIVNEADKTITFHIETSTFPNWNGVEQRRPFTLMGDELKWTTPTASGGGSGEVVLKRAK
jgi:hypothetical protein